MKKNLWLACALAFCVMASRAGCAVADNFYGDMTLEGLYNSSVYGNASSPGDLGYNLDLNLGLRSKLSRHTFSSARYRGDLSGYTTYNMESSSAHLVEGSLEQLAGDLLSFKVLGGAEYVFMLQSGNFNFCDLFLAPSFSLYPFDHTEVEAGYIYGQTSYPDYDLDSGKTGLDLRIGQEFSLNTRIELFARLTEKNYTERCLYKTPADTTPVNTAEKRKDSLLVLGAAIRQYISDGIEAEITYAGDALESNGNYFYWGPGQGEDNNTIQNDQKVLADYYAYRGNEARASLKFSFGLDSSLELNGAYRDIKYRSRPARDAEDKIKIPPEERHDGKISAGISWSSEIPSPSGPTNNTMKITYAYEQNDTNDLPDKYAGSVILLSFCMRF